MDFAYLGDNWVGAVALAFDSHRPRGGKDAHAVAAVVVVFAVAVADQHRKVSVHHKDLACDQHVEQMHDQELLHPNERAYVPLQKVFYFRTYS